MLLVFEATFTIFNRMRTLVALLALYVLPTLGYPVSEYKDQCKDLKKEAKALHSPTARSLASLFCNGYISIFVKTVNTYKACKPSIEFQFLSSHYTLTKFLIVH